MKTSLSIFFALFAIIGLASSSSSAQPSSGAAAIYKKSCAKCHGADGKGIASLQPPDFTDAKWQKAHSDAALTKGIAEGKGTMPAYKGQLTPAQIKEMVAYVRTFGPKSAAPAKKK